MANYLIEAIHALKPNSEFTLTDYDYDTIKWIVLDGQAPTKKSVTDKALELRNADQANHESLVALKDSARAKLIAGQPMSVDEAAVLIP